MAEAASSTILQVIQRVAEGRLAALPDRELLRLFRDRADEDAFHALLRRHGPMVLDVCRAVSPTAADAEDAFQATFLVLVRNAGSIRKVDSVASWLHGVAYRTARKARVASARRRKHEARAPERQPAAPDDLTWREVQLAVHEELARLAERYRVPLVLCYLLGKTQDEAAAELGLPKGTLRGRLEAARALLRARLIRRGLGPVAALLASAWPASAALPPTLATSTARTATRVVSGCAIRAAAPAAVASLTEGVIKAAFLTKARLALLVVAIAAAALGARAPSLRTGGDAPPKSEGDSPSPSGAASKPTAREEPKAGGPEQVSVSKQHPPRFAVRVADNRWRGRCAFLDDGRLLVCSDIQKVPEVRDAKTGALRKAFPEVPDKTTVSGFCLSADRKWLAAATGEEFDPTLTGTPRRDTDITVWEVSTSKPRGTVTASSLLALAPDGRTLAVTVEGKIELRDVVTGKQVKPAPFTFNAIDAAAFSPDGAWLVVSGLNEIAYWKWQDGDKYERLKVGRRVQSLAFSPDGRLLAEGPDYRTTIEVRDLATMKVTQSVSDGKSTLGIEALAFADSGRTLVAGNANLPAEKVEVPHRIHFWDVRTGKPTREIALNRGQPRSLDVSPDGESLAAVLIDGDETILAVWDLDPLPGAGAPEPDRKPDPAPGGAEEPVPGPDTDEAGQPLTPAEAVEKHGGKEVRVVFRVASVYSVFGGSVPRGQLPPFGLVPEVEKDDPRFSVLVSGELVLVLDRFGVSQLDPGKFFKGKTVEVVGKVERLDPPKGDPDSKPSYRLVVSDWRKFRVIR